MGLVMALSIVVIGTVLIAAMFNLSTVFTRTATFQRRGYIEHVSMASYLEKAKGFIVQLNEGREADNMPVLHGSGLPVSLDGVNLDSVTFTGMTALQLTQDEDGIADALSIDMALHTPNGPKRLVMRVYDANYLPSWVAISNWQDQALPPSLMLYADDLNKNGEDLEGLDDNNLTENSIDGDNLSGGGVHNKSQQYRDYGAYVVRLELYDIHNDGTGVLARDIEEGFFQAINQ
jgi:hypothetical protein